MQSAPRPSTSPSYSPVRNPGERRPTRFVERDGAATPQGDIVASSRPGRTTVTAPRREGGGVAALENLRPGDRTRAAAEGSNSIGWLATPLRRTYPHRQELGYSGDRRIGAYRTYPVRRGYAQYYGCDRGYGYADYYRPCYRPCGTGYYRRCYGGYPYYAGYYPWAYASFAPWYGYGYGGGGYAPTETVYVYGDYVAPEVTPSTPTPGYTYPTLPTQIPFETATPEPAPSESTGDAQRPSEPPLVAEGREAFTAGRYAEARDALLRAILADDQDGYAKLLYSLSSIAEKDYEDAAAALRGALEDAPDLIAEPIDVRTFYRDPAEFDRHLAELRESTQAFGPLLTPIDTDDARLLLGYVYFASAKPKEARQVFDELLERDPGDRLVSQLREAAMRVGG